MSGLELYAKYAELQVELNNCTVDLWDELDENERRVWDALAEIYFGKE